jgi:hypothetical protein
MAIRLKGSTSGSVELDVPAAVSGGDVALTLPNGIGSAEQFLKNSGTAGELEFSSMVETSTGVGIGTSSPDTKLEVSDGAITAGSSADVLIGRNSSSFPSPGAGYFKLATNNIDGSNGGLSISTLQSDSFQERLRIDSSGRVGIGTTSPQRPLHVNGTEGVLRLTSTASGNNGFEVGVGTASQAFLWNAENSHIEIATNNTERMRIDSSGNVGIGTASPVFGVGTGLEVFRSGVSTVRVSSNNQAVELRSDAGTGTLETRGAFPLKFGTQGTERLRIDSSGRLIIGTSADVSGGDNDVKLQVASGSGPSIQLCRTDSTTTANELLGRIFASTEDGGTSQVCGQITFRAEGSHTINDHATRMEFSTCPDQGSSAIERMRITSGGAVTIGRAAGVFDNTSLARFHVYNNEADKYAAVFHNDGNNVNRRGILVAAGSDSGTGISIQFEDGNGSNLGNITFDGATTSYNNTSDYRLKENVVDLDGAITRVKQLAPKRFNFIGVERNVDGFLAHEAQVVVPEAVTGEKDGEEMQGIDQSKLVPLLTAALQEAIAKIETLETKVAALEAG